MSEDSVADDVWIDEYDMRTDDALLCAAFDDETVEAAEDDYRALYQRITPEDSFHAIAVHKAEVLPKLAAELRSALREPAELAEIALLTIGFSEEVVTEYLQWAAEAGNVHSFSIHWHTLHLLHAIYSIVMRQRLGPPAADDADEEKEEKEGAPGVGTGDQNPSNWLQWLEGRCRTPPMILSPHTIDRLPKTDSPGGGTLWYHVLGAKEFKHLCYGMSFCGDTARYGSDEYSQYGLGQYLTDRLEEALEWASEHHAFRFQGDNSVIAVYRVPAGLLEGRTPHRVFPPESTPEWRGAIEKVARDGWLPDSLLWVRGPLVENALAVHLLKEPPRVRTTGAGAGAAPSYLVIKCTRLMHDLVDGHLEAILELPHAPEQEQEQEGGGPMQRSLETILEKRTPLLPLPLQSPTESRQTNPPHEEAAV